MASLAKEGLFYVKDDPQLGQIRGLDPWAVENGIHLIRMEKDAAEGIMMIRESNQQQYGTVHGGILVAFADTVAGHSLVAHGRMCVTQGSTVNFLRPASGAYLFCRGTPVKVGKRICVVSVEQRDDQDELVTTALFTFAVAKEIEPVILPPKHPGLQF
ncbi:MAG: PaaI family thioesterase [Clostridiales bacterium]|nr:PaaI family thioesterase [Clostridiales bacterium]MDY4171723.1 PaaI family thioesterase [Evtepia sp.]